MEKLLTPQEVADHFGMSTAQLAQLRYTGRGPVYLSLSPRKIRYTEAAVEEWLEAQKRTSTASAVA
jgi:predicted DNA-binding transcriptional regulator AlpA